ncbi:MAG: hypothetical protein SOV22_03735 [Blautia obeum]|nr:hypothetical protein [Blautia obeum]
MEKIIKIEEGRSLNFKASAFSPILYNRLFPGRDYLKDIETLNEENKKEEKSFNMDDYELFARIAYLFAYQGLAPSPITTEEQKEFLKKYPTVWEWIDTFNTFSIYEILPEIMDLWYQNGKGVSTEKNQHPAPPGK